MAFARPSFIDATTTGADPAGTAAAAITAHEAASDPHAGYQKESEKGAANGYPSLNGSQKVAEDPANATATPTANKIPIAAAGGKLDSWITSGSTSAAGLLQLAGDSESSASKAVKADDPRLSNARTPSAHASSHQPGGGDAMAVDAAAGTGSLRTLGFGAQQAAAGTILQWATVTVSNAEMLALRATPKTLVSAPGSGKILEFVSATFYANTAAGAYTNPQQMAIRDNNSSGQIRSGSTATGLVNTTTPTYAYASPQNCAPAANVPLVLHNTGPSEMTGGNAANTVTVIIYYRVLTLP